MSVRVEDSRFAILFPQRFVIWYRPLSARAQALKMVNWGEVLPESPNTGANIS